ncbi:hypothetical protein ACFQYP_26415 [Nonomuraea antimicrobica]
MGDCCQAWTTAPHPGVPARAPRTPGGSPYAPEQATPKDPTMPTAPSITATEAAGVAPRRDGVARTAARTVAAGGAGLPVSSSRLDGPAAR